MNNIRLKKRSLSQEDLFNFSELFKLMKPRVMSLVIFTCAVGLLTAPNLVSTKEAIIGILLVSLGAGAAGAFPPVIGWTISTGSLSLEPFTFFLIIFFWTPSHFWALSLYKSDDYKKAKLPMLPLTNGVESTKLNIFIYSLLMVPVIIFPFLIDFVGLAFLIPSLMLTFYYNYLCYQLFNFKKDRFNPKIAKTIFGYSILYLFLIFVLFLIDKII